MRGRKLAQKEIVADWAEIGFVTGRFMAFCIRDSHEMRRARALFSKNLNAGLFQRLIWLLLTD